MQFVIDPRIFDEYPGFVVGVIVAHAIDNRAQRAAAHEHLNAIQAEIGKQVTLDLLAIHPHLVPWRQAYRRFGADPKKYRSSIDALMHRIANGGSLSAINPVVDLYNSISLKYMLPAGGEDLDTIVGDLQLTYAIEHEKPATLLGDQYPRTPTPGEILYKDDEGAVCRRWNWREADRTKITDDTRNALVVIEALPPVDRELVVAATNELATLIKQYCGGSVSVTILDECSMQVPLKENNHYVALNSIQPVVISTQPVALTVHQKDQYAHALLPEHEVSQEHAVRLAKVEAMRAQAIEPWPACPPVETTCAQFLADYSKEAEQQQTSFAGRIITLRGHGKTFFAHVQDRTGSAQIYVRSDEVGVPLFEHFVQNIDVGDIIWVTGFPFITKMGEITLRVTNFKLVSKSLHPLPDKFHGLADVEVRYRQRYLDLISNEESRQKFRKRSQIITLIRSFFNAHDFLEVETPMLHPIAGGAAAKPFKTHHNALDMTLYLRIAPELYLKRLVIGGLERVYEINRCFRNEGISTRHNPEFTTIEWYIAYKDYQWLMDFNEELIKYLAQEVVGSLLVPFGPYTIDMQQPFARMTMHDAVVQLGGCSPEELTPERIDSALIRHAIPVNPAASWGAKLLLLFEELAEPNISRPTFITQHPTDISPLSKRNADNPAYSDRYELFIPGGMELSNGFTELNDPLDQAERFHEQMEARRAGDVEAHEYDADFIRALEYGLPPTAGAGIGIDRLVMVLTNTPSIKDVILFPTLKKK